jgi:hypothetical protein
MYRGARFYTYEDYFLCYCVPLPHSLSQLVPPLADYLIIILALYIRQALYHANPLLMPK